METQIEPKPNPLIVCVGRYANNTHLSKVLKNILMLNPVHQLTPAWVVSARADAVDPEHDVFPKSADHNKHVSVSINRRRDTFVNALANSVVSVVFVPPEI